MMSRMAHVILTLGAIMWDLCVSVSGCFMWMRGFRLITLGNEGSATVASVRGGGKSSRPLAGIGAALFLLAFIASEAVLTIRALRP